MNMLAIGDARFMGLGGPFDNDDLQTEWEAPISAPSIDGLMTWPRLVRVGASPSTLILKTCAFDGLPRFGGPALLCCERTFP